MKDPSDGAARSRVGDALAAATGGGNAAAQPFKRAKAAMVSSKEAVLSAAGDVLSKGTICDVAADTAPGEKWASSFRSSRHALKQSGLARPCSARLFLLPHRVVCAPDK